MADENQSAPVMTETAEASDLTDETVAEQEAAPGSADRSGDDTAETPEIQAEQASPAAAEPASKPAPQPVLKTAEAPRNTRADRIVDIEGLMIEKELLILSYTYDKVPKPYYDRWKREANEIFQLLVRTRKRRQIEQKY